MPKSPSPAAQSRRRQPPDERRTQIIAEATRLFAEHGFRANTRELAARLGVTQPLLFRYFDSKDELIDAVLERLHTSRLGTDWAVLVGDRARPLRDRLVEFSRRYAAEIYDGEWIRIYMFTGLAGGDFNRRYIATATEPLLRAIAMEVRHELHLPARARNIGRLEVNYLWLFHGGLYYHAIRRHIYGLHVDEDVQRRLIEVSVDAMLDGMERILKLPPEAQ